MTHYGNQILRENLSVLLDPGNQKSANGGGTTWYDLSGNDNHATLTNYPSFSNNSIIFDGTNYATITSNSTNLDFRISQTVCIWMKYDSSTLANRTNPYNQAYGGDGTWTLETSSSISGYYGNCGTNGTPYTAANSPYIPSSWTFIVRVRNATDDYWYINGELKVSHTNPYGVLTNVTSNDIIIADGYAGPPWKGEIGLVLIYKDDLDANQIKKLYNNTKRRFTDGIYYAPNPV